MQRVLLVRDLLTVQGDRVWPENPIRRIPRPTKGYISVRNFGTSAGECPGNSTDQTGDAKIVDTAHTSGAPAVHD